MFQLVYVKAIVVLMAISIGWHANTIYTSAKENKAIKLEIKSNNKVATTYEGNLAKLNIETQDLEKDLGVVYVESSYRCRIPTSGLLLLSKASH